MDIRKGLATLGLFGILSSSLYAQDIFYPKGLPEMLRPTKAVSEESQDKNKNGFRDEFEVGVHYEVDGKETIFNAYLVKEQTFSNPAVGWYIEGDLKDYFMYSDICRIASINLLVRDMKKNDTIKILEEKKELYEKARSLIDTRDDIKKISKLLGEYIFKKIGIPTIPESLQGLVNTTLEDILKEGFHSTLSHNVPKSFKSEDEVFQTISGFLDIKTRDIDKGITALKSMLNVIDVYGNSKETEFLNLERCLMFERDIELMAQTDSNLGYMKEIFEDEAGSFYKALKTIAKETASGSGIEADRLLNILSLDGKFEKAIERKAQIKADWQKNLWTMETTYYLRPNSGATKIADILEISPLSAEETLDEFLGRVSDSHFLNIYSMVADVDKKFLQKLINDENKIIFKETGKREVFHTEEDVVLFHVTMAYEYESEKLETGWQIGLGRSKNGAPYRVFEVDSKMKYLFGGEEALTGVLESWKKTLKDESRIYK